MDGLDVPTGKYIMVEVFDNVLDQNDINELLAWYYNGNGDVDDRIDVISKTPLPDKLWPEHIIKKVLDVVLDCPYKIESVIFFESRISFRLHTDSGDTLDQPIYNTVIIPLQIKGKASTVVFDNYYYGIDSRFSKKEISPFSYNLPDKNGKFIEVDDIRQLLTQCRADPGTITNFNVTTEFINKLEYIVRARSGSKRIRGCVTDYNQISNYHPDTEFDSAIHNEHLLHIPIENLQGLTVEKVVPWKIGQVISFDRNQLHCAGSGHECKLGITIFTNRNNADGN
jgi:hypothetical protein